MIGAHAFQPHEEEEFLEFKFITSIQPAVAYEDESVMLSGPH